MTLNITTEDINNIALAINAGGKIWENPILEDFKRKVKDYNKYLQSDQCCYCRRSMADEFNMVIDIEHVLPQKKFIKFMFEFFNLSISCKRCNMLIKGEDISFVSDLSKINDTPQDTSLYKIIHPNLDDYTAHIHYLAKVIDTKKIVKYKVLDKSDKGYFTYEYFKLSDIERKSLDSAQGIKVTEKLSNKIDPKISEKIQDLFKKI